MLLSAFCACGTLVRADHGAVDEVPTPVELSSEVSLSLELVEQAAPDSSECPAAKADVDAVPLTVAFRQVTPWCAGCEDPEDSVENSAVVVVGPPSGLLLRQEGCKAVPLLVGQVMTAQCIKLPLGQQTLGPWHTRTSTRWRVFRKPRVWCGCWGASSRNGSA